MTRRKQNRRKRQHRAAAGTDNGEIDRAGPPSIPQGGGVGPVTGLVVGLGASVGGLEAFKAFLANMPEQSGMAFVLVQHLDPHHKSLLVDLLTKYTEMQVAQAEDGMALAANHVFVIPPNAVLTIKAGVLRVSTPAPPREQRMPIDLFFTSLAEDQEERAVAVILSGSGSDGSLGLKAIKEHGGFTLAQGRVRRDGAARHAAQRRADRPRR